MKKYEVYWGDWNCSFMEVPAMNIQQAIEVALSKNKGLTVEMINKVISLGNW